MGSLAYTPQFGSVIPVALLVGHQWSTLAATAFTAIALADASYLFFGADCWAAFIASTELSRKLLLEQGGVGFEKVQSAFAAVRLLGGGIGLSYTVCKEPRRRWPFSARLGHGAAPRATA